MPRDRSRRCARGSLRSNALRGRARTKVMFVFALLDRESMRADEVAAYLGRVPFYREVSERFLGLAPAALAEWLLEELARAGAVVVADGVVRPTMAA